MFSIMRFSVFPFSALDVESEKAVQEALDYAVKGNLIFKILIFFKPK